MPPHRHQPARTDSVNELRRKNTATGTIRRSISGLPATRYNLDFPAFGRVYGRGHSPLGRARSNRESEVCPTTRARAERASELAAKVIDKLTPDDDAEEKATRKRRLIKGSEKLRDVCVDSAKQ